ncbi:MAG: hypothetical protein EF813_09890 [Methanosarcinales archaeon]|nr:MAG: hypothetical protein EF813_09890 [Methanosarcinales archaeon]
MGRAVGGAGYTTSLCGQDKCDNRSQKGWKNVFIYQNISRLKNEVDGVDEVGAIKDRIIYINFEDERLMPIRKEDFDLIWESYYELYPENVSKKLCVFFDEIQEVPFWNFAVRRIWDQENVELCITGSSSKLLSGEIVTQRWGRTLTYFIFPYSFKEFLSAKGVVLERNFEFKPLRYEIKKIAPGVYRVRRVSGGCRP